MPATVHHLPLPDATTQPPGAPDGIGEEVKTIREAEVRIAPRPSGRQPVLSRVRSAGLRRRRALSNCLAKLQTSQPVLAVRRLSARLPRDERGAVTAEYAIVILAAVAFAGLLVTIMRSEEVRAMLVQLVQNALGAAG